MRELEETLTSIQKQFSMVWRKIEGYALSDFSVKEKVKKICCEWKDKDTRKMLCDATGEE